MTANKIQLDLKLTNKYGLHARPAALFVQMANQFRSEVEVSVETMRVSGKNILDIMTLGAAAGSTISLTIAGDDADAAANALKQLIESNFNEEAVVNKNH